MNNDIPFLDDGAGPITRACRAANAWRDRCMCELVSWGARMQNAASESDEGAVTAEYAVVLVAATGFAGLLVAVLKSDAVRTMLTGIIKKALNVG